MIHRVAGVFPAALGLLLAIGCSKQPNAPPPPLIRRTAQVIVSDSLGIPAAGVDVRWVSDGDSAGFARVVLGTTDAAGAVVAVLTQGGWGVHALRDAQPRAVAGTTFTVAGATRPEADTVLVRITLHTPSIARGRARLAGRTNHSGIVVDCPPLPAAMVTDSTGTYAVDLLPPGHWSITLFCTGFRLGVVSLNVVQPGQELAMPDVVLNSDPILNTPQ